MVASILILMFIGGMVYWWGTQGWFSAFLHMVMVIFAACVAFALWEPIAYMLLGTGSFATHQAWGVGLLVPFVLMLIVPRVALDKLVPKNLDFSQLTNMIGGGACGLVTGIVASGVTVIALGFLPVGTSLAGYQPLAVDNTPGAMGKVTEGGTGLWLPVDRWTAGLFRMVASAPGAGGGAFTTSEPMGRLHPDLAREAARSRLRPDINSSSALDPASMTIGAVHNQPTPIDKLSSLDARVLPLLVGMVDAQTGASVQQSPAGKELAQLVQGSKSRVVLVDTVFKQATGTYDADSVLRLPPTQIRLMAEENGDTVEHAPVAFVDATDRAAGRRVFQPIATDRTVAFTPETSNVTFGWLFVIPKEQTPTYLTVRSVRYALPPADKVEQDPLKLGAAMGLPREATAATTAQPQDIVEIVQTDTLPEPMSAAEANGLSYDPSGKLIVSGTDTVKRVGSIQANTRVTGVFSSNLHKVVRVEMSHAAIVKHFGGASSAARNEPLTLRCDFDRKFEPIGYVLLDLPDHTQRISIDPQKTLKTAGELPLNDVNAEDRLFVYFLVTRPVTVEGLSVGSSNIKTVEPPLKIE